MHFARQGSAVWIAHLDLMRTFERAALRAALPVVWSEGYNPRPELEFALPIGVGIEARMDPMRIGLETKTDDLDRRLNAVLPAGLSIVRATPLQSGPKSLMSRVYAAEYEICLNGIDRLLPVLSEADPLVVMKHGKRGSREIDLRPGIRSHRSSGDRCLTVLVDAGSKRNIRPDLLLTALSERAGGGIDWRDAVIVRTAVCLD